MYVPVLQPIRGVGAALPPPVPPAADPGTGNLIDLDLSPQPQTQAQSPFAQNSNDIHLRLAAMSKSGASVLSAIMFTAAPHIYVCLLKYGFHYN